MARNTPTRNIDNIKKLLDQRYNKSLGYSKYK